MASPAESNNNSNPSTTTEEDQMSSNPISPTSTGFGTPFVSDVDTARDSSSKNNVHVIPTISVEGSKSFDSLDSGSNRSNSGAVDTVVKISPGSTNPQQQTIGNSFSFSDSDKNVGGPQPPSLSRSASSVASGELVLSDSNDTRFDEVTGLPVGGGGEPQQQQQQQSLPKLNTSDVAYDNNIKDENIVDRKSPASSVGSETSNASDDDSLAQSSSEEDDSEVFLAKEMALAIAKNPNMTPSQLRELQQRVQQSVERKQKEKQKSKFLGSKKLKKAQKKMKENFHGAKRQSMAGLKETKETAKAAIKEHKQNAREGAKKGLRAVGLIQKSASTTSTASVDSSVNEAARQIQLQQLEDLDGDRIRLEGTIWKRRSGLGKYSMTAPWERRRVVLKGTKLIYYKTAQEEERQGVDGEYDPDDSNSEFDAPGPVTATLAPPNAGSTAEAWINTLVEKTGVSIPWENGGGGNSSHHNNYNSIDGARGYLDLRKEKASAGASYGHTGAPTPFALSIKVASTTKYKFCFETQQELMQWLAAITDIVVGGSVDAYNAEILEANDPSTHGLADAVASDIAAAAAAWDGSPRNAANAAMAKSPEGVQLWSTEGYAVSSNDTYHSALHNSRSTFAGDDGSSDDGSKGETGFGPEDYMVDKSTAESVLTLPSRLAEPVFVALNAVLLGARSDHQLAVEWFWYMLVFFNVFLVMTVDPAKLGGTIALKPGITSRKRGQAALSSKAARRKSSKTQQYGLATIQSASTDDTERSDADALTKPATKVFVPPAGSTAIRIEDPAEVPEKDGVIFAGWREVEASGLMVRGAGYKANKTKVPCPESLYKCVELDIFESKKRVPDMAGRVVLPKASFENDDGPKTWNAPDIFVITVALPTDTPKLYGGSMDNGGGYTITMYCVMRQETRDILRRVTADGYNPTTDPQNSGDPNTSMVNAARLFDEWCRRAPSDDNWMARFKVVPQGNNLAEIGLPAWIANYNGKPFLIKRPGTTGFLYRHPDKSCMEFDVSLHPFPYLAKQGICYMKEGFFKKILATLAFCIEGRSDDELPECLIGLFQLCYPNPVHALQAEDVFSGKAPRSK